MDEQAEALEELLRQQEALEGRAGGAAKRAAGGGSPREGSGRASGGKGLEKWIPFEGDVSPPMRGKIVLTDRAGTTLALSAQDVRVVAGTARVRVGADVAVSHVAPSGPAPPSIDAPNEGLTAPSLPAMGSAGVMPRDVPRNPGVSLLPERRNCYSTSYCACAACVGIVEICCSSSPRSVTGACMGVSQCP